MSIIQSIKSAVGADSETETYECIECGSTFENPTDPGEAWFRCTECGSTDPLGRDDE